MSKQICTICPHNCELDENQTGFCGGRSNAGGKITAINYGLLTGIALDPIEKKPLHRFYPGSKILSIGSFGCNFRCSFCQNHDISMAKKDQLETRYISPEELVHLAKELMEEGNIGIAYTYNEPLIGYEYVLECSMLAKKVGLKNVLVTNGYINEEPFLKLLPYIDALNIDLKAFHQEFYKNISGELNTVKKSIQLASMHSHVEVTTLVIPGENDSEEEIRNLSKWLSSINPAIPLHLSRFFPRYHMKEKEATNVQHIHKLSNIAKEYLNFVYVGNC